MKLFTFLHSFQSLVLVTLLSGFAPGLAWAQSKAESPTSSVEVRMDLDLPASTLDQTVDELQKKFRTAGQPANVLLKGDSCSSITTPKIGLQRVTFEQAIRTVALMASPAVTVQGDPKALVIDTEAYQPRTRKMRVFNVAAFLRADEMQSDDERKRKLAEERYKDRLSSLTHAIDKGIEISQKIAPHLEQPKIELEDNAGLLFASGTPEALEIVSDVVRALCYPQETPLSAQHRPPVSKP